MQAKSYLDIQITKNDYPTMCSIKNSLNVFYLEHNKSLKHKKPWSLETNLHKQNGDNQQAKHNIPKCNFASLVNKCKAGMGGIVDQMIK